MRSETWVFAPIPYTYSVTVYYVETRVKFEIPNFGAPYAQQTINSQPRS